MAFLRSGYSHSSQSYAPEQSIQFDSASSQYMTRTPSSASNRQTFTISFWIKRTTNAFTSDEGLFYTAAGGPYFGLAFNTGSHLRLTDGIPNYELTTTSVFRDVTAWMHVVVSIDTTQGTAADRIKLYRNGEQITAFDTDNYPSSGANLDWNTTDEITLGAVFNLTSFFDGLIADMAHVDGQQLEATSFGEFDNSGIWRPLKLTSDSFTWGDNGFLLQDSTGTDQSGNGNNFTPTNTPTDSLDVPADKSIDDLGNYPRINVTFPVNSTAPTISETATKYVRNSTAPGWAPCTIKLPVDAKVYWETDIISSFNGAPLWTGIVAESRLPAYDGWAGAAGLIPSGSGGASVALDGTTLNGYLSDTSLTLKLAHAWDGNTGKYWVGSISGGVISWGDPGSGTGDPTTGDNPLDTITESVWPACGQGLTAGASRQITNTYYFDPDQWSASSPPTGYEPLCTAHLPAVAPVDPGTKVGVLTWTGDSSASRDLTGLGFQPDFVWIKNRNGANVHVLYDSVRGFAADKALATSETTEETNQTHGYVSGVSSDGFTVAEGSSSTDEVNTSGNTYVGWCIGGLTAMSGGEISSLVSSTSADITPTAISYDATLGMFIMTYTGTGAAETLPNPLGIPIGMLIHKRLDSANDWWITHKSLNDGAGLGKYRMKFTTASQAADSTAWNNTAPTASVISLGNDPNTNVNTATYVVYGFADTDAIKVGGYTGNGSTDGPFVDFGGSPLWTLGPKRMDSTGTWIITDGVRDTSNPVVHRLFAEDPAAEASTSGVVDQDYLANGFKERTTNTQLNGGTHIYLAFIENYFGGSNVTQGKAR